jgi:hypothetical protein
MPVQMTPTEETDNRQNNCTQTHQPTMESRLIAVNRNRRMPMAQFRGDGSRFQMPQFEEQGSAPNIFPRDWQDFAKSKPRAFDTFGELRE